MVVPGIDWGVWAGVVSSSFGKANLVWCTKKEGIFHDRWMDIECEEGFVETDDNGGSCDYFAITVKEVSSALKLPELRMVK